MSKSKSCGNCNFQGRCNADKNGVTYFCLLDSQIHDEKYSCGHWMEYINNISQDARVKMALDYNNSQGAQKRHKEGMRIQLKTTIVVIIVTAIGIIWSIWYSLFIYPPKYILNSSEQELIMELSNYAEFKLHFVLRNIHRGEGDISKPTLIIRSNNSKEEYVLTPRTQFITDTISSGNMTTYKSEDRGRVIHVKGYGIINEFFEYEAHLDKSYQDWQDREDTKIFEFIKNNKNNLRFRIKGEPYGETVISLTIRD